MATSEITKMFIIVERFDSLLKKLGSYQKWVTLSLIWHYFYVCPCASIRSHVCPSVGLSICLAKPRITADPGVVLHLCNLLTFIHFHLLSFTFLPFHSFSFTFNFHPFMHAFIKNGQANILAFYSQLKRVTLMHQMRVTLLNV